MSRKKEESIVIHRLSLIHQTDKASAESIVSSQNMIPGSGGLYGPGIYFANTIEACDAKALRKGVYLIADVYLGKVMKISKKKALSLRLHKDPEASKKIRNKGYNSIYGHKQATGREYIVFDSERVKNIKYIYGERPSSYFAPPIKRYVLFWVADHLEAAQIVETQALPRYDGPFGKGYYLFDSITDAKAHLGNKETYLAADMKLVSYGELRPHQTLKSRSLPSHFQTLLGQKNEIKFFIAKKPELIKNIHYCGGLPFD